MSGTSNTAPHLGVTPLCRVITWHRSIASGFWSRQCRMNGAWTGNIGWISYWNVRLLNYFEPIEWICNINWKWIRETRQNVTKISPTTAEISQAKSDICACLHAHIWTTHEYFIQKITEHQCIVSFYWLSKLCHSRSNQSLPRSHPNTTTSRDVTRDTNVTFNHA